MIDRISDGRTDLVFDLPAQGQALDATDARGVSIIKWCAYYGDVSAIRFLLANGLDLDSLGENLDLNGAVFHGHWQLCQFLLEQGADANFPAVDTGETPLHSATCKINRPAYRHVVQLLLAHGANPNVATKPGVETGALMRDCRTKGETPLHRAAAFSPLEIVQMLLDAGALIEARDANGETPLSWASWHQRSAAILQKLCYGPHRITSSHVALYTNDHGQGWGGLEANTRGRPHV